MAGTPTPNLGVTKRYSLYISGTKVGRDYLAMRSFNWSRTYAEWTEEYLGDSLEIPGQRCTGANGDFEVDELDAKYCNDIEQALADAERTGLRPDIKLVERTLSNSGTVSKVTFENIALKPAVSGAGKNEIVKRKYTWRSSVPKTE